MLEPLLLVKVGVIKRIGGEEGKGCMEFCRVRVAELSGIHTFRLI